MRKIIFFCWALVAGLGGTSYAEHAIAAGNSAAEQVAVRAVAETDAAAAATVAEEERSVPILERLEDTALAGWVNKSKVVYPAVLCMHVIGLAILVGILTMLDLRLLGLVTGIPLSALAPMIKFAWTGFIINAISGLALFAAQATTMAASGPFLTKITLVFLGAITTVVIQRRLRSNAGVRDDASTPSTLRTLAVLSLVLWMGAISAGRLIPYFNK